MFQSAIRIIPLILISTLLISCKSQVVSGPSGIEEPQSPESVGSGSSNPSENSVSFPTGNPSPSGSSVGNITAPVLIQKQVTLIKPQRVMQVAAVSEPVNASYQGCIE